MMVAVASVFLLGIGRRSCSVSGCAALIARIFPPLQTVGRCALLRVRVRRLGFGVVISATVPRPLSLIHLWPYAAFIVGRFRRSRCWFGSALCSCPVSLCALLSSVAAVSCCHLCSCRRVRPAPCRWVFFVIGAPRLSVAPTFAGVAVLVAVASVFLLRLSIDTAVMVAALIGGHCRRSVSGCALSSVRLDCQLLPPLPVSC